MNISVTSGSIATKFYQASLGCGKAALGLGLDLIGTLVSMAKDSSHRVMMSALVPSFLIGSSYLKVTRIFITSRTSSKFSQIRPRTAELAALERLEKSP